MSIIPRISRIPKFLANRKSLLILGPRGSGKSVYINALLAESGYEVFKIDLLETDTFKKYVSAPHLFRKEVEYKLKNLQPGPLYILVDEVQKIPQLLDEVHLLIQRYQQRVVFILTGSSARKLKSEHVNLLAGRAVRIPFFPFSTEEIHDELVLAKALQFGLLPEVFVTHDHELIIEYLKTYTGVYLKEEIMQESLTRNIEAFSKFLEIAAFTNASPILCAKIARQVGISDQTVKGHFQILEDTLICRKIPAWTFSVKKQLQKAAKYYFFDNGVLNALTGELATELKESSSRYGRLFENFVVNEIIKYNENHGHYHRLFHYRTNHGQEIDLIVQKNATTPPIAIEIKSSEIPRASDMRNLRHFTEEHKGAKGLVLCRAREPYTEEAITVFPYAEGIEHIFRDW